MLQMAKTARERWNERVGAARALLTPSPFPDDAVAVIYKPARSAMTSGKARTREWKLRFEPRSPKFIEPLMGWTGSDDTLAQVELTFPSAQAAVAYARQQGLSYVLHGDLEGNVGPIASAAASARRDGGARPWRLEWVERTLGPEIIAKGLHPGEDPSSRYANPEDVLADPALSVAEKREVLRRWALDAYLIELALAKGNSVPHASRIDEVVDALIDINGSVTGSPTSLPPDSAGNAARPAA